ncbi:hypothetical protein LTR84_006208 [Exophiala bonariae]|uniref:rRNA-processing protein EFG1 n=1 Tax=Exophiala bonariae TaxID=1690606 RepID=A0AAV9N242_9EURO|nr:hypothetical protein LTR84_006208 [Exophiala bonariae]
MDHYSPKSRARNRASPDRDRRGRDHRSSSYRTPANSRHMDSYRPDQAKQPDRADRRDRGDRTSQHHSRTQRTEQLPPKTAGIKKKTKRARTTNPSTRIHSLKKLLNGSSNLPMTVRQEKERELAALLIDQEKKRIADDGRRNLSKYHFVRFIERQKCERSLKRLIQQRDTLDGQDESSKVHLEQKIHEGEVDLNYTKYAPLGEKYISLFPNLGNRKNNLPMPTEDSAILNSQEADDLLNFEDEQSNLLRLASDEKPPMWYQVEECMLEGQLKLEALREGKLTAGTKLDKELTAVGNKNEVASRVERDQRLLRDPSLADENVIDQPDQDSDGNMSDGGFFER